MKHTVKLPLERETKGALLYRDNGISERDPLYLADGLYIRKAGMAQALGGNAWPHTITLTIEAAD